MTATAQYPRQLEPIFSSRQSESPEAGQCLTLYVYFSDGSYDAETERLADYGNWIAAELITEAEERLTRTLTRRIAAREAEARSAVGGILVK